MKIRIMLIICLLVMSAGTLAAENFRIGITGTLEIDGNPFDESSWTNATAMKRFFPGFYWEVLLDHVGFGMTCLGRFTSHDSSIPGVRQWDFEWIGSMDLRFHFIKDSMFDPFVEAGIGCAGWIDFSDFSDAYARLAGLSLFGAVGGGLALRLDALHVGIRVLYRFFNDAPPATPFDPASVTAFESALFVGVSF